VPDAGDEDAYQGRDVGWSDCGWFGALLGVVSSTGDLESSENSSGECWRPHLALPVWVCRTLLSIR